MSQMKSVAVAALLGIGVAGFSGHSSAANAESGYTSRAKMYAQTDARGGEVSIRPAQNPALKSQDADPWAITSPSGVHIQSRAGFVGYR
jgi:hypothetical protein